MIYNINVSATNSSVVVTWNTDQPSSAIVYYDTTAIRMTEADATNGVSISGTPKLAHTDLTTSHSASIGGLQSNTTYTYVIYVRDAYGNVSVTWPTTFHTN
jgi:hypothetical protein